MKEFMMSPEWAKRLAISESTKQADQTTVLTEQQITDQKDSHVPYVRMLNAGVQMLLIRQYQKEVDALPKSSAEVAA